MQFIILRTANGGISMSLKSRVRNSEFFAFLDWHTEDGKGRRCMLLSSFLYTLVNSISTGALYTAFLAANDFSIVDASFLSVIPPLAACFCVISPVFLERFQKRRWLLAGGRLLAYLLNLLCLTLLAIFVKDPTTRLVGFSVILLVSNLVNNLFSSGYTVWHLNFISGKHRARYLSYNQITTTVASFCSLIFFGLLADSLKGTAYEATVLIVIRFVALAFALLDVVILCLPKEYPYLRKETTIRISNIIRLPLKHKKFLMTMALICMWNFTAAFSASSWTFHLLHNIGAGVVMTYLFSIFTCGCLFTSAYWRRLIEKVSWFRTFAYCAMIHAPAALLMAFVLPENRLWLYPICMFIQAFAGVGLNLSWGNMPYINTPREDQTYYLSFYTLIANLGTFLGGSAGALFVKIFDGRNLSILGRAFDTAPMMLFVQFGFYLICIGYIFLNLQKLQPSNDF